MTTAEKIEHLLHVKEALDKRLKILRTGKKIEEFDYMTP